MPDSWENVDLLPSWSDLIGILPPKVFPTAGWLENNGHTLCIVTLDPGYEMKPAQERIWSAASNETGVTILLLWGLPGLRVRAEVYDYMSHRTLFDELDTGGAQFRQFVHDWWETARIYPR